MKKSSPLVFGTVQKAATDVDKLIAHGYEEAACRDALASAKGNFDLAIKHLSSSGEAKNAPPKLAWVSEVAGEWRDKDLGVGPMMGGMMSAEARALWKSPYYIRVGDCVRQNKSTSTSSKSVLYTVIVITRDGSSWELTKSLADFYSFWTQLPFGMGLHSKLHLKTGFPLWKLNSLSLKTMVMGSFRSEMTEDEIEERRVLLENWIRELCLDEDCMTNAPFLAALELFIEAEQHHPSSNGSASSGSGSGSGGKSTAKPLPLGKISPLQQAGRSPGDGLHTWTKLPPHTTSAPFPVQFGATMAKLPTKLDLAEVFGDSCQDSNATAESFTDKDVTVKQLAKDMSRDRVVIQGERFQGVDSSLEELVQAGSRAAQRALELSNALPLPEAAVAELALRALRQVSRTESAYISHTALSLAISLEEVPDLAIIPESLLAEPLRIHFRADTEKKSAATPSSSSTSTSTSTSTCKSSGIVRVSSSDSNPEIIETGAVTTVDACVLNGPVAMSSVGSDVPTATPVSLTSSSSDQESSESLPVAFSNPFDSNNSTSSASSSDSISVSVSPTSSTNASQSPFFRTAPSKSQSKPAITVSPFLKTSSNTTTQPQKMTKDTRRQMMTETRGKKSAPNLFGPPSPPVPSAPPGTGKKKMPLPVPGKRLHPPPHPAAAPAGGTKQAHVGSGGGCGGGGAATIQANLICDLQATTVFRYTNIMTMQCALQLRVTYCKSIKLLYTAADGSSSPTGKEMKTTGVAGSVAVKEDSEEDKEDLLESVSISPMGSNSPTRTPDNNPSKVPGPVFQSSKCFVILERETQTSSRDWRHDQTC